MHMPYDSTPEQLAAARAEFEAAGMKIIGGGNVSLRGDENEVKKMLTYAKNAGFPIVVCAPRTDNLDVVEKYAKQFGLKIAIHNHGPKDNFPNGTAVFKAVKNMDPCMGLCYDIGHAAQTGVNVVEEIKAASSRIYDVHMKDMAVLDDNDNWVNVGEGKIPVPEIFQTLKKTALPRHGRPGIRNPPQGAATGHGRIIRLHARRARRPGVLAGCGPARAVLRLDGSPSGS